MEAYVAKCPPAVSGQKGHDTTISVAGQLARIAREEGVTFGDFERVFRPYATQCQPPWSETEIQHKLADAWKAAEGTPFRGEARHNSGRGSANGYSANGHHNLAASNGSQPHPVAPPLEIPDTLEMPVPLADPTRVLLKTCFEEGEQIRIVPALFGEDGKEHPDGKGPVLERKEWLRKLDEADGDPNKLWSQSMGAGIYMAVNPLDGVDVKDPNVTAFRHTLIEFDDLGIEEQWCVYRQTNLPCSAIIYSGGRSLHAWVKVDARDRKEYDERVRFLHEYFKSHDIDTANKNPSRLSRLPGCHRRLPKQPERKQELWAINAGAPTWDDWRTDIELANELKPISWDEIEQPVSMDDNLLGDRLLERGQGIFLFGPSGCGKSVAALQAQAEWAAGMDGLHIKPQRPLRIVVLQTEDSVNDVRENMAGILDPFTTEQRFLCRQNLIILPPVAGGDEASLAALIAKVSAAYKPDLISVNPLLAFVSADPTRNLGTLLYQHVDPAIKKGQRVGFMGVHHTPKMNRMDTKNYGSFDHQYLAAGDARVANWPRAMIQIEPVSGNIYLFRVAKRAARCGWTWDQKPTNERYFKHHKPIRWVDATPEQAKAAKDQVKNRNYRNLVNAFTEKEPRVSRQRLYDNAQEFLNIGESKAAKWLALCIEDKIILRVEGLSENNRKTVLFERAPTLPPPTSENAA